MEIKKIFSNIGGGNMSSNNKEDKINIPNIVGIAPAAVDLDYPDKCDICGAAYGAHRHLCTQKSETGYWGLNQYSSYYTYQDDVLKKHFNYAKTGVFNLANYFLNIYLITILKYIDLYPEDPILSGRGDDIIEDIKYFINDLVEYDENNKGLTITEYEQLVITQIADLLVNKLNEWGINLFDITSMFWRLEDSTKYTILYDKILFSKLNKDNKNQIAIFKDMEFSSYYIPNKYSSKIKYTVEVNVTNVTSDTDYTVTPSAMVKINPIFNSYYGTDTKTGCMQYYKALDTKSDTYTVQFYGPPCSKFHDMASGIKLGSIKDKFTFTRAAMYLNDSIVDETTERDTFLMPHVEQKDGDHVKVVVDLKTNMKSGPIYIDFKYLRTEPNTYERVYTAGFRYDETIDVHLQFYAVIWKNGQFLRNQFAVIPKGKNSTTIGLNSITEKIVDIVDCNPKKIPDGRVPTYGRTVDN